MITYYMEIISQKAISFILYEQYTSAVQTPVACIGLRACLSRYDQSAWTAKNDKTRNDAQMCSRISAHLGLHIKKRNDKLVTHQKVS